MQVTTRLGQGDINHPAHRPPKAWAPGTEGETQVTGHSRACGQRRFPPVQALLTHTFHGLGRTNIRKSKQTGAQQGGGSDMKPEFRRQSTSTATWGVRACLPPFYRRES